MRRLSLVLAIIVAVGVQHGAAAQCAGLSASGPGDRQPGAPERSDDESSSLIRTGSTLGGRSGVPLMLTTARGTAAQILAQL